MTKLSDLKSELLRDGKITANEVAVIRQFIEDDGHLDFDDAKFLVQLLGEASEVCQEFDDLFLPLLRHVFLRDGKIDAAEQEVLIDMLFAGGRIRESELQLLHDLQIESTELTPEFSKLCEIVLSDFSSDVSPQA